jgi:hypothetical protein
MTDTDVRSVCENAQTKEIDRKKWGVFGRGVCRKLPHVNRTSIDLQDRA